MSSLTEVGTNGLAALSDRSRHFRALNAWMPSPTEVGPLRLGRPLRPRSAQMDLLPSPTGVGTSGLGWPGCPTTIPKGTRGSVCPVRYPEADVYQEGAHVGAFYLGGTHTSIISRPRGGLTGKECILPQTIVLSNPDFWTTSK